MNIIEQEIRQLLDRYYDGEATAEDVSKLRQMLDKADGLPADLEQDREIFRAIDLADVVMPDGVEARIESAIDAADRRWRRRLVMRMVSVGCAAAACLAVVFIPAYRTGGVDGNDMQLIAQAESVGRYDSDMRVDVSERLSEGSDAVVGDTYMPEAKRSGKRAENSSSPKRKRGARIMADSEEAVMYVNRMLGEVAQSLQAADLTVSEAISDQMKYKETINKLLE